MSASLARAETTRFSHTVVRPGVAQAVVIVAFVAGAGAGLAIGAHVRGDTSDIELTHLLRAMALLKLLFVAAATGAIMWRLQAPVMPLRLAAYAVVCLAMAMGPGLIWCLAYIGLASILLHGGVAGAAFVLWRDNASSELLEAAIRRRRALAR